MPRKLIVASLAVFAIAMTGIGWLLWNKGTSHVPSSSRPPLVAAPVAALDVLHGKPIRYGMEFIGNTATVLSDGRVLFAGEGGLDLFDPATGLFTHAGGEQWQRWASTYTPLADGRVLELGGFDKFDKPRDNLINDVRGGTASVTGVMQTPRGGYSSTLLADGRVLIAGGGGAQTRKPIAAELYDPVTGKFAATGTLATARSGHAATLLADGRVLITGGEVKDGRGNVKPASSAELYDPTTGTFSRAGNMTAPRTEHSATLLKSGAVLIVGGRISSRDIDHSALKGKENNDAELWDPASGAFSVTGALPGSRTGHTATLLDDGMVLVTGGAHSPDFPVAHAWLYDPVARQFSTLGDMDNPRIGHTATLLPDGRVLIAGGDLEDAPGDMSIQTCQFYDPKTRQFVAAPPLRAGRDWQTALLQPDGRVLMHGGWGLGGQMGDEWYDPAKGSGPQLPVFREGRWGHTAIQLQDGRVLLAGGLDQYYVATGQALLFDPATNKLSFTGDMKQARLSAGATRLADGRVLIVGGFSDRPSGTPLESAELYDPKSGTFSMAGQMKVKRAQANVTLLPDGRVLVTGGNSWEESTMSTRAGSIAEIWNPASKSFSVASATTAARDGASATRLANGTVLLVGGEKSPLSAELYDSKNGIFIVGGNVLMPRRRHLAVALHDGRVLIAGGEEDEKDAPRCDCKCESHECAEPPKPVPKDSAELYDPATGGFFGGFSFEHVGRIMYVVQLKDGRLFVLGEDGAGLFDLAQLRRPFKAS